MRLNKKFKIYKVRLNFANAKSQSAMEFIMNYGWAFLIVLIVIFSLIYFGVLDPSRFVPEKADLQEGVDIVDVAADENSISFILRNTMGKDLLDFQINATECNDGEGILSTPVNIPEGKTKKITVYCEHDYAVGSKIDSGLEALWKTRTSTKGERYDFDQKTRGDMKVTVNTGKELFDRVRTVACGTLNLTRTTYILQGNISTTGTCFNITADNIEIDGNGYSITGDAGATDYGVVTTDYLSNITIKNFGNIGNFTKGLNLTNLNNSFIYNNTMISSVPQTTYAIYFNNGNSNKVENNNIRWNATSLDKSSRGIFFRTHIDGISENNNITGNNITVNSDGSSSYGVSFYNYGGSSNSNTIKHNFLDVRAKLRAYSLFIYDYHGTSMINNKLQYNVLNVESTDHSAYGVYMGAPYELSLTSNEIYNMTINVNSSATDPSLNSCGILLMGANLTNVSLNRINSSAPNINASDIYLTYYSHNNIFYDNNLLGENWSVYMHNPGGTTPGANNSFLNTTYNGSEFVGDEGELTRKWYYKASVRTDSASIIGATVTALNSSGSVIDTLTTGSDGWTEKGEVIEYVNNAGTKNNYNNYTINVSDAAYVGQHSNYNVTLVNNTLDDIISVVIADPYVAFSLGTPYDGSSQAESDISVNVTTGTSNGNVSTFIDFDDSLVSWWRMDDLGLGDELVTNGDFSSGLDSWDLNVVDEWTNEFDESALWTAMLGDNEILTQTIATTSGKTYNVKFTVTQIIPGPSGMFAYFGTTLLSYVDGVEYNQNIIASGNNIAMEFRPQTDIEGSYAVDDVSVKEVDTVQDYMNRNNGIAINATQTDSGRMGKGFDFDGDGDYIVAGDDDTLDFDNSSEYTWALWVKYQGFPNEQQCFLSKDPPPPPVPKGSGFNLCFNNSPGGGDIVVCNYNSEWDCSTGLGLNLSADTWHHIAIIYDGNSGWQIHNNGQDMGEITKEINSDSAADYFIGAGTLDGFPPQLPKYYFNGTIDDVMIFNRSLSADEVAGLYASSSSKYLGNNFTGLGSGDHTFKAYVQDTSGNVNSTEERTVTIS